MNKLNLIYLKLVGIWFMNEYLTLRNIYRNDMPSCVQFVEMGPGRGTLMNDMLRVILNKN